MGMSSSRRYGMQEITMVTTSNSSSWKAWIADNGLHLLDVIKWYALGNVYTQESPSIRPIIDFSGNTGEETVVIKSNKGLRRFGCQSMKLTTLDVTKNKALYYLSCGFDNQLTVLDVSKNIILDTLEANDMNSLTTIYVNQTQLDILNGVTPQPQGWHWVKGAHTKYVLKQ